MHKLSLELEELLGTANPNGVKVGELVDTMSRRGFGFLLVALSLPSALPIPAVGYSVPFALLITGLAVQIIVGRSSPSLPQRVRSKSISAKMVAFIKNRGIPFFEKDREILKAAPRKIE